VAEQILGSANGTCAGRLASICRAGLHPNRSGGAERGGAIAANSCDYGARGKLIAKRERSTGAKHETLTDRLQGKYDRAIP
jgi:hypothetical protein